MTVTVSLYSNEYVKRLEDDRDALLRNLADIPWTDVSLEEVIKLVSQPLPPRRGAGQIQDGAKHE